MRSMSPELGVLTNQVDEITNIHSSPISMKILIVNITDGPDIHWGSVLGVSN